MGVTDSLNCDASRRYCPAAHAMCCSTLAAPQPCLSIPAAMPRAQKCPQHGGGSMCPFCRHGCAQCCTEGCCAQCCTESCTQCCRDSWESRHRNVHCAGMPTQGRKVPGPNTAAGTFGRLRTLGQALPWCALCSPRERSMNSPTAASARECPQVPDGIARLLCTDSCKSRGLHRPHQRSNTAGATMRVTDMCSATHRPPRAAHDAAAAAAPHTV